LEKDFYPVEGNHAPVLVDLMRMTESEFKEKFRFSPIKRARYSGFLRNVAVALGNTRDARAVPVLARALCHPESLVRAHAAWALGQIRGDAALEALNRASREETNLLVREEIGMALRGLDLAK
jgi:epoxyqueuosine reductase